MQSPFASLCGLSRPRPRPIALTSTCTEGQLNARDPAGSLRASWSLLQEYSQKREAAEIPRTASTARGGRRGTPAIYSSAHAIAAANQAFQIREITPSILAHERDDAI